jgi:hypothetical protein
MQLINKVFKYNGYSVDFVLYSTQSFIQYRISRGRKFNNFTFIQLCCGVTGRLWIYFTWFCPSGVSSDGSGRHVEQRQVESAVMEVAGFISLYLKFLNTTRRQRKQFQGGDWRWMAVGFNLEPSSWKCWPWEFSVDSVEKSNLLPSLLAVCGGCC